MVSAEHWDIQLAEHSGHLLQSWSWGEFKRGQGWAPERVAVSGSSGVGMAQVLFRHRGPLSIGYIPRGPVLAGDCAAVWPQLRAAIDRCVADPALVTRLSAQARGSVGPMLDADRMIDSYLDLFAELVARCREGVRQPELAA